MFKGFQKGTIFKGFPVLSYRSNHEAWGYSNVAVWLDAAIGLNTQTNAANVSLWQDRISGFNYIQASAASQPIYRSSDVSYNNYPVVDFNTSSKSLNCAVSPNFSAATGTLAVVCGRTTSNQASIIGNGAAQGFFAGFNASGPNMRSTSNVDTVSSLGAGATPHIIIFTATNIIVDGAVGYSGSNPNMSMALSAIGLNLNTGNSLVGKIAEIVMYNQKLSSADCVTLSDNINGKYAIY